MNKEQWLINNGWIRERNIELYIHPLWYHEKYNWCGFEAACDIQSKIDKEQHDLALKQHD